jgi:type IX secretion system PorP/SprF family membrane protein
MRKGILYIIILILSILHSNAQDPYLSQPYSSPQFLNTASVGSGQYDQRINGNIRTQFIDNNKSYQTIFAGWDWRTPNTGYDGDNYLGMGLNVLSDQIMNGAINSNHVTFNVAYHMFLNEHYNNISLGLGASYTNTTVDRTKLIFADQYDAYANLSNNTTAEIFKNNASKFSMNVGLAFNRHTENEFFETGGSLNFQSMPDLLTTTLNSRLSYKSSVYVNYETKLYNNFTASFHASYINRTNNSQILTGGSIGLPFSNYEDIDKRMYVGCYYRVGDAFIPSVKLLLNKNILGFSYDIYNNDITQARLRQNTFEMSFSTSIGNRRNKLFRTIYD